jgi:hypothetical protein
MQNRVAMVYHRAQIFTVEDRSDEKTFNPGNRSLLPA